MSLGRLLLLAAWCAMAVATSVACTRGDTATSGTSITAPSTSPADPITTETFTGTLGRNATVFYSFTVASYGTVNITLDEVTGVQVSEDVPFEFEIGPGVPRGTGCSPNSVLVVAPGEGPHSSGVFDAGIWCVRLRELGNMPGPARFRITIAHP
jgi:hypothetical protein